MRMKCLQKNRSTPREDASCGKDNLSLLFYTASRWGARKQMAWDYYPFQGLTLCMTSVEGRNWWGSWHLFAIHSQWRCAHCMHASDSASMCMLTLNHHWFPPQPQVSSAMHLCSIIERASKCKHGFQWQHLCQTNGSILQGPLLKLVALSLFLRPSCFVRPPTRSWDITLPYMQLHCVEELLSGNR